MKILPILIIACLTPLCVQAQLEIFRSGNWNDANPGTTPWLGDVPASTVADSVVMDDNFNVTVINTDNITSGSLTTGNNNTLTVQGGGTLQLGDMTHVRYLTAGTNMTISVQNNGTIIIWGNLVVNNSLIIAIQGPNGKIIVKGNVTLANNATLAVSGDLEVDGSFTAGTGTNVTVGAGGSISVFGPTSVGAGSSVIGAGQFHTYGGCSGPGSFCNSAPVELTYFTAEPALESIKLTWSTASESNFDYFLVEKSTDAKLFTELTSVTGHGTTALRNDYSAEDNKPRLGKSYYRLTEVDLDKSVHPLNVVEVEFTGAKLFNVYPNPTSGGQVTFELNFVPDSEAVVSVIDLRGVTLTEISINSGSVTMPLQLASGMYLVMLRTNDYRSVSRLLVK